MEEEYEDTTPAAPVHHLFLDAPGDLSFMASRSRRTSLLHTGYLSVVNLNSLTLSLLAPPSSYTPRLLQHASSSSTAAAAAIAMTAAHPCPCLTRHGVRRDLQRTH